MKGVLVCLDMVMVMDTVMVDTVMAVDVAVVDVAVVVAVVFAAVVDVAVVIEEDAVVVLAITNFIIISDMF